MARLSLRFPESFLRTFPCNRPKSRAHSRRWTKISSSSADHRFARGNVASVPFLKREGKIFARSHHFSSGIARNCECLRNVPPIFFCLRVLWAAFVLPEIRDAPGRRAPLHSKSD